MQSFTFWSTVGSVKSSPSPCSKSKHNDQRPNSSAITFATPLSPEKRSKHPFLWNSFLAPGGKTNWSMGKLSNSALALALSRLCSGISSRGSSVFLASSAAPFSSSLPLTASSFGWDAGPASSSVFSTFMGLIWPDFGETSSPPCTVTLVQIFLRQQLFKRWKIC